MSPRMWRVVAAIFGMIGRWAEAIHNDLHQEDDPGCKGCEVRRATRS